MEVEKDSSGFTLPGNSTLTIIIKNISVNNWYL